MIKKRLLSFGLKTFFVLTALVFLTSIGYCEKINIAYTGNTYASLYPCGTCPASVGGGVARRITVLNELAKDANLIRVDSGNFTASGVFDTKSIGPAEDKARTMAHYTAMAKMGYEVVGVGENEFSFGVDFLTSTIDTMPFKFVSANLNIDGVSAHYIKDIGGIRIGFVGLSPKSIYKKYGAEVKDYDKSLKKALDDIKGKCDVVILLSAIGEEESLDLIKKFPQVSGAIVSGPLLANGGFQQGEEYFLARPFYEGKAVAMVSFDSSRTTAKDMSFSEKRLSLDIEENKDLKKIIPTCFRDEDCPHRHSLVNKCQEPGKVSSECAYYAAESIQTTIVTDKSCLSCSTTLTESVLKDIFIGMKFNKIDYKSQEGQELIKVYSPPSLPLFIIEEKIDKEKGFDNIKDFTKKDNGAYVLSQGMAGMFMFLDRKEVPKRIDFFIDLYEENMEGVFGKLVDFCKKENITLNTYLVRKEQEGLNYASEEIDVALAVKDLFLEKFSQYILLRSSQIKQTSWVNTLDKIGISYKKVQRKIRSKKMDSLRSKNDEFTKEIGIFEGNAMVITNNRIFKVYDIDFDELKEML
jgi:hypothetical protein